MFPSCFLFFFFNDTATTEIYTLSLHDALPISARRGERGTRESCGGSSAREPGQDEGRRDRPGVRVRRHHLDLVHRSEEHTSELQSRLHLVCRLLLEKKKKKEIITDHTTPQHA